MNVERVNFGATLICDRKFAVVTGGYERDFHVGCSCEVYNVVANTWKPGTSMKKKRTAHSICETAGGKYVYAFGGQDENMIPLKCIERAGFTDPDNPEVGMSHWEILELQLPQPLCNVGCIPISRSEILLFGGISIGQD